jgi:transcriptional regulator with XRE-family HTH domain
MHFGERIFMATFHKEHFEQFLGIVRKYMQVRGPLSQKELADLIDVSESALSRFINQKTGEISSSLVARITAVLQIPLHEIIDFIDVDHEDKFRRDVRYFSGEKNILSQDEIPRDEGEDIKPFQHENTLKRTFQERRAPKQEWDAGLNFKGSRGQPLAGTMSSAVSNDQTLLTQIEDLSPRQKSFMVDFLNSNMEHRDLMVDIGNYLMIYFRQKGKRP